MPLIDFYTDFATGPTGTITLVINYQNNTVNQIKIVKLFLHSNILYNILIIYQF